MKQIKFRGRDKETGEWSYGDFCKALSSDYPAIRDWTRLKYIAVEPESVAQLVGYDKDGKEVYEDDIMLDESGNPFIVEFKPHGCKYQIDGGRRIYSAVTFEMTGHNAVKNFRLKRD